MWNFFEANVGEWLETFAEPQINGDLIESAESTVKLEKKSLDKWVSFFRSELFKYQNIERDLKKIDRHFCLNAYPTNGATKYHVILLGKLSTFPSTRNKQKKNRKQNNYSKAISC